MQRSYELGNSIERYSVWMSREKEKPLAEARRPEGKTTYCSRS
jgi:hypothetical protein